MNKTSLLPFAISATILASLGSCDKDSAIGQSISGDKIAVVVDSSFTVKASTHPMGRVQSRTTAQLLGRINVPGYGNLQSDIVTQFMPSSQMAPSQVKAADVDSLILSLLMSSGEFVGDSVVPMGLEVYRLTKNLPSPIYSDFDPTGYYDENAPLAGVVYNVSTETNDSASWAADAETTIEINVKMPITLGREIYQAFLDDNSNFSSPTAFADNVFKGVYIKNSFGSGRLIRSSSTLMTMYYHYEEEDSTITGYGDYFAVTPEVVTNNDISMKISQEIQDKVDAGAYIVMAPVGLEVSMEFPAREIIDYYNANSSNLKVLNTLTFSVPGRSLENDFSIVRPTYLLMVLTKDKEDFFANNKLPDNITSFYATYDSTTQTYQFGQMREYILDLLEKDEITSEDYTFTIMPVSCIFESSNSYYYTTSTLTSVSPYMASPVMGELLMDEAKIIFSFSTQTITK